MKSVILGDIHKKENYLQNQELPFGYAVEDFFDWYCNSDYNNPDYNLILLGDLTEHSMVSGKINGFFIDLFLNRIKNKMITIVSGNHDLDKSQNNLDTFSSIPNVRIIKQLEVEKIDNSNVLYLPYYYVSARGESVESAYSNLEEKYSSQHYDFCFGHIFDETLDFGGNTKFLSNLSYLDIDMKILGHNHSFNKTSGGNYLGSISPNSYTENGEDKYIAVVDFQEKTIEFIQVPVFLGYYDVNYPNDLPEINHKYAILRIRDAIDKVDAKKFYEKQAQERNLKVYIRTRDIQLKDSQLSLFEEESENTDRPPSDYFSEYATQSNLNDNVVEICNRVLQTKV